MRSTGERWSRLRSQMFGPASDESFRVRTSDWIRVAAAIVLLFLGARHAGSTTATEQAIFDFFNTLPNWLLPVFRNLYRLGALWAVGTVAVAALVGRRWRLARTLLIAGILAWGFGRLLGQIVIEGSLAHSLGAVERLGSSPAFPAVRLAVLVAVMRAAAPYVTRPTRQIGRVLIVGYVLAGMYLGTAYPNDVFGALVLGWAIAAVVHLAFGSPGGRPTSEQVRRSLAELGIHADDIRLTRRQPTGFTLMRAHDATGPLRIKVIGRDEADAQFLAKLWRFIVYRDSGPRLAWTRLQQVEHEAYLMLVAREHGVRVPLVVTAGTAGPRAALLVHRPVAGVRLSDLATELVDQALLEQVWEQVACLHANAHVVHGALDADHVVISAEGPWLIGFAAGNSSGSVHHTAVDVAQLLAATASIVGNERAVRAAAAALGADAVLAALPLLQPSVLPRRVLHFLGLGRGSARQRLTHLRQVGGAVLGVEAPELVMLQRVRRTSLAMAIGTLVAAGVLLGDVGDPTNVWAMFRNANGTWILVAFVLSFASNIGFAIGLQGTVPLRLPLWPTTELQVAVSFSNLAVPGIGGTGMQVRYLQKQGVDLPSAIAAGGLLATVGNLVAAVGLFGLAIAVEPAHVDLSLLPTSGLGELTLAIASAVCVAAAVIGGVPRIRRAVMPGVIRAASTVWTVVRSPRQLLLLIGGNVLATLLATWSLAACLLAFGGHVSFWPLMAANIGVITIASTVPIPGGGTAVGTFGLSAVLVAFGVREDIAVATALANQLIYFYVPAIPGWFATRHLARHDYL